MVVDDEKDIQPLQALFDGVDAAKNINIYLDALPFNAAEAIARHSPGPGELQDLDITPKDLKLPDEAMLLLRRAFNDCKSIDVEPLVPGFSTDSVLCVHARLKLSNAGPRPLPFFVKVDDIVKVQNELSRYEEYVRYFVPFNLRPNFETRRTVSGVRLGLLVSNYVEDAESLLRVVDRGHGGQALHSLFENAMRGWRMQAANTGGNVIEAALRHFKWRDPHADVVAQGRVLGAARTPSDIRQELIKRSPLTYVVAPMHGDLHAKNIQVRLSESILIDFLYSDQGPMLWDHAALDVSLLFDDPPTLFSRGTVWDQIVESSYQYGQLKHVPGPTHRTDAGHCRLTAVRKVRFYALGEQTPGDEYVALIALQLLRRSGFYAPGRDDIQPYARAYALADKLVDALPRS